MQRKSYITLSLYSILLAGSAFTFTVVADSPQTLWMTLGGLAVSFAVRRPLPRTTRTYVYSGVAVIGLTTLHNQFFMVEADRFLFLPADLYCPLLIFLGLVLTFFDERETTISAILGASLLSMMIAGNTFGMVDRNVRFALGNRFLEDLHVFYASMAGLQLLAMLFLLGRAVQPASVGRRTRYRLWRAAVVLIAVVLVAAGGVGLRYAALTFGERMQGFYRYLVSRYMLTQRSRIMFDRNPGLWETVPAKARSDRAVVLRARGPKAPGYLRGRAYENYADGHWSAGEETLPLQVEYSGGQVTLGIYYRFGESAGALNTMMFDIYPASRFMSDTLIVPGNTTALATVGDEVSTDENGTLFVEGWDRDAGYSVRPRTYAFGSAFQGPPMNEPGQSRYLHIPAALRPSINRISADIFGGADNYAPLVQAERLKEFFRVNFTYALGQRMRAGTDPLLQFLVEKRKGHCELFASSAVLLLRSRGIPARYVTGFVCAEQHPMGEYWLARLEDAHAWAEMYAGDDIGWTLVECTPPAGIPGEEAGFGWLTMLIDQLAMLWKTAFAEIKRGTVAQAVITTLAYLGKLIWFLIANALRGGLILLILTLFGYRQWRKRRAAREARHAGFAETVRELRQMFEALETRLRKNGVVRKPTQTVRELVAELADNEDVPERDNILNWLLRYESLRYAATPPTPEQVGKLREQWTRL
ncbi:MAG: transglutaminase domain-containing protein [Candidatus Pacebacteria bacterium]|nr:transglutaminase domain-containing protein [Candidatus Paceibacterota bacterium]